MQGDTKVNSILIFIIGLLSLLAGIFAFFNPLAATVSAEQLAAWLFLFIGFMELFSALKLRHIKKIFRTLIFSAIIALLVGSFLLFKPLEGVVVLTAALAVLFLVSGIIKIAYAFMFRNEKSYFLGQILSGLISIVLAALIFGDFPTSAASILGILLSIELLFSGASLIMVSLFFKKQEKMLTNN